MTVESLATPFPARPSGRRIRWHDLVVAGRAPECAYCLHPLAVAREHYELLSPWRCLSGFHRPTVDHVVSVARGGLDVLSNTVLACIYCNSRKGARSVRKLVLG